MGPALCLRSPANHMAWATLSLDRTLTIILIWPNALLRAAECLHWAKPNTPNVLLIVLNGSKETLISGVWYARMGPALCLGSAVDLMAWATLSSKGTLHIA
jgi:hypothetical protein